MQKEIIFIGLGRMGQGMALHLAEQGFTVHGFDVSVNMREQAAAAGVTVHDSLEAAVAAMPGKKIVWLMVPSKFVDAVLGDVSQLLTHGDIVIDGGNSFFKDTLRRHELLNASGLQYVDCGTSGGVHGARYGAALMVGGDDATITEIEPIFTALAAPDAYAHVGKTGAGHFVKMVHNGIEYGMMGALAEGMSYIEDHTEHLGIRTTEVLKPYQHGSVIAGSLMGWLSDAYLLPGYLAGIAGEVPRGETEEEMEFIITASKTPVLEAAVAQRKATRSHPSRIGTLLSAMRNQFGGHAVVKKE